MTAPSTHGPSREARNLHWLLANLVEEVPGLLSVAVVSSDGLLLLSYDPASDPSGGRDTAGGHAAVRDPHAQGPAGTHGAGDPDAAGTEGPQGSAADLATIVSGLGSLTLGAARLMDGGRVKQTVVTMREGNLCVMAISDGSLLGVHATPESDMSIVAYHMAFFVSRAGHVLTPELRTELRQSAEHRSVPDQPAGHGAAAGRAPEGAARTRTAHEPERLPAGGQDRPPAYGTPAGRSLGCA